jgi:signal transduction histidine kinase
LSNLRSRLAAVGGTMTVDSGPREGTVVGGSIPLR